MGKRILLVVFAVVAVFGVGAAVWLGLQPSYTPPPPDVPPPAGPAVSEDTFADQLRTDPIAALNASLAAYPGTGFAAEFRKRERMGGKLGD